MNHAHRTATAPAPTLALPTPAPAPRAVRPVPGQAPAPGVDPWAAVLLDEEMAPPEVVADGAALTPQTAPPAAPGEGPPGLDEQAQGEVLLQGQLAGQEEANPDEESPGAPADAAPAIAPGDPAAGEGEAGVAPEEGQEAGAEAQVAAAVEDAPLIPPPTGPPPAPAAPPEPAAALAVGGALVAPTPEAGDPFTASLYQVYSGQSPQAHAAMNQVTLGGISASLVSTGADIGVEVEGLCAQVDGMVGERLARVQAVRAQAEAELRAGFSAARTQLATGFDGALTRLQADSTAALAKVDTDLAAQQGALTAGFDARAQALQQLGVDAAAGFSTAFQSKVDAVRQLGETRAGQAEARAQAAASAYAGRGGEGIDGERNRARADAARAVGADYAAGIRESVAELVAELSKGAANAPSTMQQLVQPVGAELTTHQTQAHEALQQAAESARQQVQQQRDAATTALGEARTQAESQLASQEEANVGEIGAKGTAIEQNVQAAGDALKAQIRTAGAGLTERHAAMSAQITAVLASGEMPEAGGFAQAAAGMLAELQVSLEAQRAAMRALVPQGFAQIDGHLTSSLDQLGQAAQDASAQASVAAGEAVAAVGESATTFQTQLGELTTQAGQTGTELVTNALAGADQVLATTSQRLADQEGTVCAELDGVRANVDGRLQETLGKLNGDISKEAEKAADKIQPWWKKALSVVVQVVVAIAVTALVAAFATVTLGLGPIVAMVIAGAAAGMAATFAGDCMQALYTGEFRLSSGRTYLAMAVMGGAMGGLGGWLGPTIKGLSVFGRLGAGSGLSLVGSTLDQVLDVTLMGQPWSWTELLVGGAVGAATMGLFLMVPSVGERLRSALFRGPGSNTWNNFQRSFSRVPGLSGSTPAQRSHIYNLVGDKLGEAPEKIVDDVIKELADLERGGGPLVDRDDVVHLDDLIRGK